MIESTVSEPIAIEGLTGGAAWRRQALRVVRTSPSAASGHATPAARIRRDRSFAQHGLLGAPHTLVVRIAIEADGAHAGADDVDVTFDVPEACASIETESSAGWYGPSEGWTFTVTCLGDRATIALSRTRPLAAGELSEATFRVTLADGADLGDGLTLRATGRGAADGSEWADSARLHVDRVGL